MQKTDEKTLAHISSHILIRDKNSKVILCNKSIKNVMQHQNKKDVENKIDE